MVGFKSWKWDVSFWWSAGSDNVDLERTLEDYLPVLLGMISSGTPPSLSQNYSFVSFLHTIRGFRQFGVEKWRTFNVFNVYLVVGLLQ